ncbi:EEF1A lysine methyltransferase 1 isoform X2 [Pogona vitticeps]
MRPSGRRLDKPALEYSKESCAGTVKPICVDSQDHSKNYGYRIACISAPSVYQKLKEQNSKDFSTCLLEYDRRFSVYGAEYVFYDYNNPLDLPANLVAHSFDIVLADPPYLSEECLSKTAETIKYLTKGKILLCTGSIMEEYAAKYLGVKMCTFIPKHTRNLANEFRCYVNYDSGLDSDSVS